MLARGQRRCAERIRLRDMHECTTTMERHTVPPAAARPAAATDSSSSSSRAGMCRGGGSRCSSPAKRSGSPSAMPVKMVQIMIASVDQSPAPRRIAMGKAAYTAMHKQLSDRLAALEAQRELAFSADAPPK